MYIYFFIYVNIFLYIDRYTCFYFRKCLMETLHVSIPGSEHACLYAVCFSEASLLGPSANWSWRMNKLKSLAAFGVLSVVIFWSNYGVSMRHFCTDPIDLATGTAVPLASSSESVCEKRTLQNDLFDYQWTLGWLKKNGELKRVNNTHPRFS